MIVYVTIGRPLAVPSARVARVVIRADWGCAARACFTHSGQCTPTAACVWHSGQMVRPHRWQRMKLSRSGCR